MKRKGKGRGKNKPLSDQAKAIASFIETIKELRERVIPLNPGNKDVTEAIKALEKKLIGPALLRAAADAGMLSEIERAIRKLPKQTYFDRLVEEAYTSLRVPGGCSFPTYDEICCEYCRITGKKRTDSIASAVRRSAVKQNFVVTKLKNTN